MATVNERLQKVNLRVAGVVRRLGFLVGRAYFQQRGFDAYGKPLPFEEIPILSFDYQETPSDADGAGFGLERKIRSVKFTVNRDWLDARKDSIKDGVLAVRYRTGETLQPVAIASIDRDDNSTIAAIVVAEVAKHAFPIQEP